MGEQESVAAEIITFGPFRFDLGNHRLTRQGQRIDLALQPARVLALLVRRAGTVVTREELRDLLWQGMIVEFDQGINFCIREIRRALGDSGRTPHYIETRRGKGYRFMVPVVRVDPSKVKRHVSKRVARVLGVAGVLTAVGLAALASRSTPHDSVAIMPPEPTAILPPASAAAAESVYTLVPSLPASGGLAIGPGDTLYVGDYGDGANSPTGSTVFRVTPAGEVAVISTDFQGAAGGAVGADGTVYWSSYVDGLIKAIRPDGRTETIASGHVAPVGIAIGPDETIYVSQCAAASVYTVGSDGETGILATSTLLRCPEGIAVAEDGTLYVCNFHSDAIVRIPPGGDPEVVARVPSGNCTHLTITGGYLYFVAHRANQIYRLSRTGEVELVAGTGERGYRDGPGLAASFSRPNGIVASADGRRLFVQEWLPISGEVAKPNRIRVVVLGPADS